MIAWQGLSSKTSAVDSTVGISAYQENTRLRIDGELQRRWGMIASGLPKQDGPILLIASAIRGNFLTFDIGGGEVDGFSPLPPPTIDGPKWKKPQVIGGNPQPPVIDSITFSPTSPPATYVIGNVTMTANVTYDGLSGPLLYDWPNDIFGLGIPGATAPRLSAVGNVAVYTFDFSCTPGAYPFQLTVDTNLFNASLPTSYTVL